MSIKNVQFTVATHVLAGLAYSAATGVSGLTSAALATSVNAEPSFVRRVISKLAKANLVTTTRGKNGACSLARPAKTITLLDIYRASEAPATFSIHHYPIECECPVSANISDCMSGVLAYAQEGFEERLAMRSLAELVAQMCPLARQNGKAAAMDIYGSATN